MIRVMASHAFSIKLSPNELLAYCQLDPRKNIYSILNQITKLIIQDNVFQNGIWNTAGILAGHTGSIGSTIYCLYPTWELSLVS